MANRYSGMSSNDITNIKPISKMTVVELKDYIRIATGEANLRILSNESDNPTIINRINYLKAQGTGNLSSEGIGFGFQYKSKSALKNQAYALSQFNKFDIYSEAGKKQIEAEERRALRSYNKGGHGTRLNINQFRELTTIYGALGTELLQQLDSDQVRALYDDVRHSKSKNINLTDRIQKAYANRNEGATGEDVIQSVRDELKQEGIL